MVSLGLSINLPESKNVLICGCGGGYDIYTGMPIYNNLVKSGKNVLCANITFTDIDKLEKYSTEIEDGLFPIEYSPGVGIGETYPDNYIPEWWLSKYLNTSVYAILPNGVVPLIRNFKYIVEKHKIDTIILVDGGIDSLMRGDEEDIGSYTEDISTLLAVSKIDVKNKLLVCNAWGLEGYISQNQFFENVSALTKSKDFLGCHFFTSSSSDGSFYIKVLKECFPENSTINIGLSASIMGCSWDEKTEWLQKRIDSDKEDYELFNELKLIHWIGCPLGGIYWFFNLEGVVDRLVYEKEKLLQSTLSYHVTHQVHQYRYDQKLVDIDGNYIGHRKSKYF
jgi:hypothetical protein